MTYRVETDRELRRTYTVYSDDGSLIIRTTNLTLAREAKTWQEENKKT
jgi:hypothetical protein